MKQIDQSTLNVQLLELYGIGDDSISFYVRNNLMGFPMSKINEIYGHYEEIGFIKYNSNLIYTIIEDMNCMTFNDRDGDIWFKQYNDFDNEILHVNINGYIRKTSYNDNNQRIKIQTNTNLLKEFSYDDRGNLIKIVNADECEIYQYNDQNLIVKYNSKSYSYTKEYDDRGNELLFDENNGYSTIKKYDNNNNCIYICTPHNTIYKKFNNKNQEIEYKDANNIIVKTEYDDRGNIVFRDHNIYGADVYEYEFVNMHLRKIIKNQIDYVIIPEF